jgi:hypothetical protein
MKNLLTLSLLAISLTAFGQQDTTDLKEYINAKFPNNTSRVITPLRLREVAIEQMRSSPNKFQENTLEESLTVTDSIYSDNGFFKWDGASYVEIGESTPTLNSVLFEGNTTDGRNINISDGDAIYFDNGSRIRKGITDMSNGGAKGVALVCSIDYELKWEAGRLYILQQDGFTIREVRYNFTITPTVNDDATKGFVIGSKWVMDDGLEYVCADSATGAAVWDISTLWEQEDGVISPVSANIVQANDIRTTGTYQFTTDSLDLGFAALPFIGSGGLYGNGFFINGIGDFSSFSASNHTLFSGYLSDGGLSFMQIDTTSIRLRSVSSDGEDTQFETSLELFSDTAISGVQSLFSLNARARNLGFVNISSQVDTKLRLQLSAFDRYDQQISYLGIDTEYVAIVAPKVEIQSDVTVEKFDGEFANFQVRGNNYNTLYYGGSEDGYFSILEIRVRDTSNTAYGQELLVLDVLSGFKVESTNDAGLRSTISSNENSILMDNSNQDTIMISNADGIIISPVSTPPNVGDVLTAVSTRGVVEWQTPEYSSGTYTPSVTNMVNIASTTTIKSNWSRVGNIVTVAGYVSVTTSGNGLAQLGLSLPVASNFTTRYEGSGTLTTIDHFGEIYSHVSNDNVVLEFQHSGSTGADEFRYVFVYEIL